MHTNLTDEEKEDFTGIGAYETIDRQYIGDYIKGKEHGIGLYGSRFNDGNYRHCYVGEFNNDKVEGMGIKSYSNTELYVGEYKNNERNGIGYTKFVTGGIFIGEHKNHIINGFGVFITWERLKFIGYCYNSSPTPNGKWYDKNDNEIDIIKLGYNEFGKHIDGDTIVWPTGAKYTGTMRNWKPHGLGTKLWENGIAYTGSWKDGKMEGQGTMTYQFGDTYVGKWKNGFHHGQGTYTSLDGRTFIGEFKNHHEWNGNIYRK